MNTPERIKRLVESLLEQVPLDHCNPCEWALLSAKNGRVSGDSRYRQIVQSQTDLILRSLPNTTITFANNAICSVLGRPLSEVIGIPWSQFVPPEDLEKLHRKIAALTPENPTFEHVNQNYGPNNQIGWTQWHNLGIFDQHRQLTEIQSVGRDITVLQEKILRERALNRVFQAIHYSLDLETIFATAATETAKLLKNLDCFVVQYLPELKIWRHIAEFRHNLDAPSTIGLEISDVGNSFAEQLKRLQKVCVEDTSHLADTVNQKVAHTLPGAWLLIPLVIDGSLWGSFTLSTTQCPFVWQEEQVELAQSVANQLEVAIQQANLYHQLQLELEERRRIEGALRESETRFQNMAANVPGAIFRYLLRPDGSDSVLYMSPGCYELWEIPAEEVIEDATVLWQMIHPEDLPGMYASVMESGRSLTPWAYEWRIKTPSGREKWLEAAGRPTQQPNSDVIWDTLILDVSERRQLETERQQAEAAFRESESRFQKMADNLPGILYGYRLRPDGTDQYTYISSGFREVYGIEPDGALQDTRIVWDMTHPDDMERLRASVAASYQTMQTWQCQYRVITSSGDLKWMQGVSRPTRQPNGDVIWDGLIIDITDRRQAEEALRESESRYRLLAQNMNDLVCLHDLQGHYLYVSPSCEALLGYQPDELLGQNPYQLFHPDDRDRIYQEAHRAALGGKPTPITYRIRHKFGHDIWFETLTKPIVDASGQIVQLQTTSRDVTERIQVQNQLKYDALHDSLTGLPNRHLLMKRLEFAIQRAKRVEDYCFAVLFLDLDRFKVINDSLGHLAGDQLLIEIAHKLQATIRTSDIVARLGGDEFVVLLEEFKDIQEAVRTAEDIFAALQSPLVLEGREVYTTFSVGIAVGTKAYEQASHLLRDADIAMYQAKTSGKARYAVFNAEMHAQAINRLNLENDLRRAIEHQEFVLHYQPIVSLDTGKLVGFEALIRWQHPTQGLKFPGDFIAIAEETGLITRLDCWTLRTACRQLVMWQTAFPELATLKMSVNLSARDLQHSNLREEVDRVLTQTGLPGRCLTLEITESMLIEDIESTIHLLSQLKQREVQISIDDFGTGYSSLNYLHRLPVDSLKVDRTFVNQIQVGKRNHQIVETIAALSNQLELNAIAEGIETLPQLERLQNLGYKFGQGYLFSKPLSQQAVEALLTRDCPLNFFSGPEFHS